MTEQEFADKFNEIAKSTMKPFMDKDEIKKRVDEMTDKDGNVSNTQLAIMLSVMSMEYTNKLTHDLFKEFIVSK